MPSWGVLIQRKPGITEPVVLRLGRGIRPLRIDDEVPELFILYDDFLRSKKRILESDEALQMTELTLVQWQDRITSNITIG